MCPGLLFNKSLKQILGSFRQLICITKKTILNLIFESNKKNVENGKTEQDVMLSYMTCFSFIKPHVVLWVMSKVCYKFGQFDREERK